jgi:hypothetical protein
MTDYNGPVLTLDELLGPVLDPSESSESFEGEEESRSKSTGYVYRESDSYKLFPSRDSTSTTPQRTSYSVSDKTPSKSQRIRDYMEANPEARNRDVVEALGEFGITAADVSNAKAQLKRKAEPVKRSRGGGEAAAAPASSSAAAAQDAAGQIGMSEIDAALTFVRQMGSINRARQLLVIIEQIKETK